MNNTASIYAGGRIIADDIRNVAPLSAYKGSDEALSTGVGTLQNDDSLFLALSADTIYHFELFFGYKGGVQGSSDIKFGFSLPTGATMRWTRQGITTAGAVAQLTWNDETATPTLGANGVGVTCAGLIKGTVVISDTAGNLQFRWCQNSGTAVTTTVLTGSELLAMAI